MWSEKKRAASHTTVHLLDSFHLERALYEKVVELKLGHEAYYTNS